MMEAPEENIELEALEAVRKQDHVAMYLFVYHW